MNKQYLDLEVSLLDVQPKIWRRFLIRSESTFIDLHEAIQVACGWSNYHLFAFRDLSGAPVAMLPDDDVLEQEAPDAAEVKLSSVFGPSVQQCLYEYDFGDSWDHRIDLVDTLVLDESFDRKLIDGERAFPPEDCGGIPGYEDCVKVAGGFEGQTISGPARELLEWLGDWQPWRFDLEAARKNFDR